MLAFALCIGQTPLSAPAKERIVRCLSSVSCLLSAIGMLAAMCASAEPKSQLSLVGGMLLDGYGGAPVHHAAILVEGNRIVAAGPASEIEIPPGTPVIDTRGETMMPGMIETHAHLVIVGHGDYGS